MTMVAAHLLDGLTSSPVLERAVALCLEQGGLRRHAQRLRERLAAARQQVLSRLHSDDDAATGRAALALRTSMRNQLPCTVQAVALSGQLARVELRLPDGTAACGPVADRGGGRCAVLW